MNAIQCGKEVDLDKLIHKSFEIMNTHSIAKCVRQSL